MATVLDVVLVAGRYDAGDGRDPRVAEWPPHPARVLSALRSVADGDDLEPLRALERLAPPAVHASEIVSEGHSRSYVVTNSISQKGGNLTHLGRTSGLRERKTAFPRQPRVQMVWRDDAELSDANVDHLDGLARRVPYLGRSTSVVLMGVRRVDEVVVPDGLEVHEPCSRGFGSQTLRVPYAGYVDELDALFDEGYSAWQASDGGRADQAYRLASGREQNKPASRLAVSAVGSHYADLVVLRFTDRRPAGRLTSVCTSALRSMVMSRTSEPLPPAVHGHGTNGQPHVAYLGLPFVGSPRADGHLVALAVAIPKLGADERQRIIQGILGEEREGVVDLKVPGFNRTFSLLYDPSEQRPRSATVGHWCREATHWVTATPVVLDRYPKRGDLHMEVARSLVNAGLPAPVDVRVSQSPLTQGGVRLSSSELPGKARGRLYCHAQVRFDRPVSGPVLAGAGRYFGVGLFLPEGTAREVGREE